jgi:molybdenum cofactor synthesis domain-containing protein
VRAAVVTVSDGVSEGTRRDESGDVLADLLAGEGFEVERLVVPDDASQVAAALGELAAGEAALVVTTGGTGVAPRDVTPEATASVVERHVPGIPEALRAHALAQTPHGMLSRGVAGIRGRTLIVNLPGSPGGARDGFEVLRPALEHALRLIAGAETAHRQT